MYGLIDKLQASSAITGETSFIRISTFFHNSNVEPRATNTGHFLFVRIGRPDKEVPKGNVQIERSGYMLSILNIKFFQFLQNNG